MRSLIDFLPDQSGDRCAVGQYVNLFLQLIAPEPRQCFRPDEPIEDTRSQSDLISG